MPAKLNKKEIIDRWSGLDPTTPIALTPIEPKHKGSTYAEDTIRITGSQEFIDSVLARIKDLIAWDSGATRVDPVYAESIERLRDQETGEIKSGNPTGSWVFYFRCKERGTGRTGRKRGSINKSKEDPELLRVVLRADNAIEKAAERPEKHSPEKIDRAIKEYGKRPTEPVYAFGQRFEDEDTGVSEWEWSEPIDHPFFPCETYDDIISCGNRIEDIKKRNKALKSEKFAIAEITFTKGGKIKISEV